jgi:hypothetical protein
VNVANLTVTVRILVGAHGVAIWRLKVLGFAARLLRVPIDVKGDEDS